MYTPEITHRGDCPNPRCKQSDRHGCSRANQLRQLRESLDIDSTLLLMTKLLIKSSWQAKSQPENSAKLITGKRDYMPIRLNI